MSTKRASMAKGLVVGAASGLAVTGAVCAAVAPRKDLGIDVVWREMSRYRYAHRGLHDAQLGVPENSLEAFRLARAEGFAAELDVHLSADGIPVVVHDSDLMRLTGSPGIVERLTYHQLASYQLQGSYFGIPTLEEVLSLYEWGLDGVMPPPLLVELKVEGNARALCETTMHVLDAHDVRYMVQSFDPTALAWLRINRPELMRGQLTANFLNEQDMALSRRVAAATLVSTLVSNVATRPDFIACNLQDIDMPSMQLSSRVMGAHMALWTIRTPEELAYCDCLEALAIFEGFLPSSPTRDEGSVA